MIIIISPAKAMNTSRGGPAWQELPDFLSKTEAVLGKLKSMDYDSLKKLWKCSDEIAKLNYQRISRMELRSELSPALLAYDGIQYQYISAKEFSELQWEYVQKHLRIISGFYGVLRPLDGIRPYRLEMQAKLPVGDSKDLYGYWGDSIADNICASTNCIIDLASKEYSQCVSRHLKPGVRLINCVFGEETGGKPVEKATMCKIARGEMVRWMAENRIEDCDLLRNFEGRYHSFSRKYSNENTFVFLRKK